MELAPSLAHEIDSLIVNNGLLDLAATAGLETQSTYRGKNKKI